MGPHSSCLGGVGAARAEAALSWPLARSWVAVAPFAVEWWGGQRRPRLSSSVHQAGRGAPSSPRGYGGNERGGRGRERPSPRRAAEEEEEPRRIGQRMSRHSFSGEDKQRNSGAERYVNLALSKMVDYSRGPTAYLLIWSFKLCLAQTSETCEHPLIAAHTAVVEGHPERGTNHAHPTTPAVGAKAVVGKRILKR